MSTAKKKPATGVEINAPMISIGANKDAVREVRGAINDILRTPHVDNNTKVEALRALNTACAVSNTTLSNLNLTQVERG